MVGTESVPMREMGSRISNKQKNENELNENILLRLLLNRESRSEQSKRRWICLSLSARKKCVRVKAKRGI